jgi:hypothetical protein
MPPAPHYTCNAGTSVNNLDGTSAWTWDCNGSGGGTNATGCSEAKPSVSCTTAAQCNDNNSCTTDYCVANVCHNDVVSGLHGSCGGNSCNLTPNTASDCTPSCTTNAGCGGGGSVGYCGTADGQSYAYDITIGYFPQSFCSSGAASNFTGSTGAGGWSWNCGGDSCSAGYSLAGGSGFPPTCSPSSLSGSVGIPINPINIIKTAGSADGPYSWNVRRIVPLSSNVSARMWVDNDTVSSGGSTVIHWLLNNATSAKITSDDGTGNPDPNFDNRSISNSVSSDVTGNLTSPMTYRLTVNGPGGPVTQDITVYVYWGFGFGFIYPTSAHLVPSSLYSDGVAQGDSFVLSCSGAGAITPAFFATPAGCTVLSAGAGYGVFSCNTNDPHFPIGTNDVTCQSNVNYSSSHALIDVNNPNPVNFVSGSGKVVSFIPSTTGTYIVEATDAMMSAPSCSTVTVGQSLPDLTAGTASPTSATVGTAQIFSALIANIGGGSTLIGFRNFFQVASATNGGGTISNLSSTAMSTLASGSAAMATSPTYTFGSIGTYSVRACADKSSAVDIGTIAELNENNNCGAWTDVVASVASQKPTMISPAPGSTLSGSAQTFTWSAGSGVITYGIWVGSTFGTNNLASPSVDHVLTTNITGLPTNGSTLYVRLWGQMPYGWDSTDYTYTATSLGSLPTVNFTANPTSVSSGGSTTLTWSSTNAVSCSASGGWTASGLSTSGSHTVTNLTTSTSFTMTCGGVSQPAFVTVNLQNFSVTVDKTVGGSVKSSDGNISCGAICSHTYTSGANVILTAIPDNANWKFIGWTGDCSGVGTCSLTVNGIKSVKALFVPMPSDYREF